MAGKGKTAMETNLKGNISMWKKFMITCAVLAMISVQLGYDIGVMNGAVIYFRKDLHLNDLQVDILVGSLNLFCLVGAALAGRTSDAIDRRWTMSLAALLFLVGVIVMSLAPSFAWLMVGRLIAAMGVGYALIIAPVYTAEVAPLTFCCRLTCFPDIFMDIFINVGILLGYVANYAFQGLPPHYSWRFMVGLGGISPIAVGLFVMMMPQSPRWLVMKNRNDDALDVLQKTSNSQAEVSERLEEILKNDDGASDQLKSDENTCGKLLYRLTPANGWMFIAVLGVQLFLCASGIEVTEYYIPVTLEKGGLKSQNAILGATMAMAFVKTAFIVVAAFYIDKIGRRRLLLMSTVGSTASLAALAICLFTAEKSLGRHHEAAALMAIVASCLNVVFFSTALGRVNWVAGAEIFPLTVRAKAASLGIVLNRVVSGVVTMTFMSLSHGITESGAFFLYAAFSGLAVIFFYFCVPETKGKTQRSSSPAELEEQGGSSVSKFCNTTKTTLLAVCDDDDMAIKSSLLRCEASYHMLLIFRTNVPLWPTVC